MYKPRGKNEELLDAAWDHVQSVPYGVTLRWLFYRLFQDGVVGGKEDYKGFVKILAMARKQFYRGWRPNSLVDDTRRATFRGNGHLAENAWRQSVVTETKANLARWIGQRQYLEIWFEAGAMHSQFAHYTDDITLRPFRGDPSLDYKWEIAHWLGMANRYYDLPIVVLYFGDLDRKGLSIPKNAIRDIREWCDVDFEVVRCGLNPGDEVRYNIPESFDHPGAYQWEALDDGAARELIQSSVARHIDFGAKAQIVRREMAETARFNNFCAPFLDGHPIYSRGHIPVDGR